MRRVLRILRAQKANRAQVLARGLAIWADQTSATDHPQPAESRPFLAPLVHEHGDARPSLDVTDTGKLARIRDRLGLVVERRVDEVGPGGRDVHERDGDE